MPLVLLIVTNLVAIALMVAVVMAILNYLFPSSRVRSAGVRRPRPKPRASKHKNSYISQYRPKI